MRAFRLTTVHPSPSNNLRFFLTFIFCVSIYVFSLGQTFTPTVIASAGEVYTNSQGSLSVTIGEMSAVETFQNVGANLIINQGFQQYEQNRTVPLKFISFFAKRMAVAIPPIPAPIIAIFIQT
jgi:hypothetical protein